MKMKIAGLAFGLFIFSASGVALEPCVQMKQCRIEKKTFEKSSWKTELEKSVQPDKVCLADDYRSQIEPNLGFALVTGNAEGAKLQLELYTSKRTFIVASAEAPATAESIKLTYRLSPKGNSLVEVTCSK